MSAKFVGEGWLLEFYARSSVFADAGLEVAGSEDIMAWARRNGAREGTPFFLRPDGRPDARVNRFWREPSVRCMAAGTIRRYAFALKVWLDFVQCYGVAWDEADAEILAAFKEWRLSAEQAPDHVAVGTFRTDLAALRRFYEWAAACYPQVRNPVGLRAVGSTTLGRPPARLEAAPSGVRRADVKWLTPDAYREWRDMGLRGFTREGVPAESWVGGNEDRDVAFADGLFGTGLRCGEWSSLLTVEVPALSERRIYRRWLAWACAKGRLGRPYWMPVGVARAVRSYLDEGSRTSAVRRAQQSGRYDQLPDRWLLEQVRDDGKAAILTDPAGRSRKASLDALDPSIRMRLFRYGPEGIEPVWLWLSQNGMPRPKQAWSKTFAAANSRVSRELADSADSTARLWARPHMLRHSFALRWYSIATFVAWQRTAGLSAAEQRQMRDQLGDVWFLLASLLGHRSAETTRSIYLEPFQALQVEQLVALMDADDRMALERLVDTVARNEPRVLQATG